MTVPHRLRSITTSTGALDFGRLTVLIGPNNVGKSQTLRDIRSYFEGGKNRARVIAEEVTPILPGAADRILEGLEVRPDSKNVEMRRVQGLQPQLTSPAEVAFHPSYLDSWMTNTNTLIQHMGKFWIAHLDAESRLQIARSTDCFDPKADNPSNPVQRLFQLGEIGRAMLREGFLQVFGRDIALDWTRMRRWTLRISDDFGQLPQDRDGLSALMEDAESLDDQGDGYRSVAGLMLALISTRDRLVLLDEPEAFLHPVQARMFGRWLSSFVCAHDVQTVVATHNAPFLSGLLEGDPSLTIVRMNRDHETTRFSSVRAELVRELTHSPVLLSQPVMEAVFRRGVVLCEGDPDRAIYQAVAGLSDLRVQAEEIHFLHTNGKDGMHVIVELLRGMNVPTAAIVDIDVLNGPDVLGRLWLAQAGQEIPAEIESARRAFHAAVERTPESELLAVLRSNVQEWCTRPDPSLRAARKRLREIAVASSMWRAVKRDGYVAAPGGSDAFGAVRAAAEKVGIFIVPTGELEGWMPDCGRKGAVFNRRALEQIRSGACPEAMRSFVGATLSFVCS